ncbi:MAG: QacE family quaternary ammonium compound efflux SMR transporter [Aestuariivita sp.]|nr:QacE family quaternary ammonium compound efflux SMR transporter [Aestuariivita sp.]
MKSYIFLSLAIIFEVGGTMLLPMSQNFSELFPTLGLIFAYVVSFYFLTFALATIPVAIVYATWAGLGVFLIALLGKIFFSQPLTWPIVLGLSLIVIGVVIVNSFSHSEITE